MSYYSFRVHDSKNALWLVYRCVKPAGIVAVVRDDKGTQDLRIDGTPVLGLDEFEVTPKSFKEIIDIASARNLLQ